MLTRKHLDLSLRPSPSRPSSAGRRVRRGWEGRERPRRRRGRYARPPPPCSSPGGLILGEPGFGEGGGWSAVGGVDRTRPALPPPEPVEDPDHPRLPGLRQLDPEPGRLLPLVV